MDAEAAVLRLDAPLRPIQAWVPADLLVQSPAGHGMVGGAVCAYSFCLLIRSCTTLHRQLSAPVKSPLAHLIQWHTPRCQQPV